MLAAVLRALEQHARLIIVTLACGIFAAILLPLNFGLGAHAEEVIGLLDVAPERLYPPGESVSPSELSGEPGFRTSDHLPVWGYASADGGYTPLMIDGHMGALPFYGARLLARGGGLMAARAHSTALGVLAILLIYAFARRVGGARVGLVAALLAGTSPHLTYVFSMVRPDEQLHAFAHMAAVLALIRFAACKRARWLYLGCLLFGFGIAAKNTAIWALVAVAIAALCFRIVPRARPRDWAIGAVAFLLPLVPQILYLLLGESTGAMSDRAGMVPAPWESLAPSGLWSSITTFGEAVGHGGTRVGGYIAGTPGGAPALPGVGIALFAAALVAVASCFSRTSAVGVRAFGGGFGLLLLQHLAFYYRGEAYFELLAPWIPVAVALAGVGLWNTAATLRAPQMRRAAQVGVVAAGMVVFANSGAEVARYHRGVANPGALMFSRDAQVLAAQYLESAAIERPFVTTYGAVGVYELLSNGNVRPRHLFPYFLSVSEGGPEEYDAAWKSILSRLGAGEHVFLLSPNPSPLDTSPCQRGDLIALRLWPTVIALGGGLRGLAEYRTESGKQILAIVRVTLPPMKTANRSTRR